jgi:hypothetical protein
MNNGISEYYVMLRVCGNRYRTATTGDQVRGQRADKMWVFGTPRNPTQLRLERDLEPIKSRIESMGGSVEFLG